MTDARESVRLHVCASPCRDNIDPLVCSRVLCWMNVFAGPRGHCGCSVCVPAPRANGTRVHATSRAGTLPCWVQKTSLKMVMSAFISFLLVFLHSLPASAASCVNCASGTSGSYMYMSERYRRILVAVAKICYTTRTFANAIMPRTRPRWATNCAIRHSRGPPRSCKASASDRFARTVDRFCRRSF
jgi:hypothetical protein